MLENEGVPAGQKYSAVATVKDCETVGECLDAAQEHIIDVLSFLMAAREGTNAEGETEDTSALDDMYIALQAMDDELQDLKEEYD